ncbi:hypothetical protein DXA30_06610 [Fusobacterium ulcerans]|uniref:hypothetical protein n=1 Tax=Fusobacterium ulcerans TaxID=861 RepID=UPI000E494DF2|nr:hypothetical protein [Fusobacterium ulcerans]RGY65160.1 hypothetical protein DXA30_06610 [Fusobacterium ulcerans]
MKRKKEQKKNYKINQALNEYMTRQEWNEDNKYQIPYTEESVKILFEQNGLQLNKKGKEFYNKLIDFFGGEELKDENGNQLTVSKQEYQIGKIVRYYANNVALNFS